MSWVDPSTHGDLEELIYVDVCECIDFSLFRKPKEFTVNDRFYPFKPKQQNKRKFKPNNLNEAIEWEFRYKWRQFILFKFEGRCAKCGEFNLSNHAHHIWNISQNPKIRYRAFNGILFCKKCHNTFHSHYGYQDNNIEQIINYLYGV